MSRSRRVFNKEFKAKVVLEALKEKNTIEVLAKTRAIANRRSLYELLPQSNFDLKI